MFTITADNATNNDTLASELREAIKTLGEKSDQPCMTRLPCLAHVIQLASNKLLLKLRIDPKNEQAITASDSGDNVSARQALRGEEGALWTLKKVSCL